MADISLRINGDASGASEAFDEAAGGAEGLGDSVGKSVVKWQALLSVATKTAEAVVKFGVDGVKAYVESERVLKQLERASGQYSAALAKQSEALSRLSAVDGEVIQQSATLLTQWAGVGAAANDVQKAILDYAAATGVDAVAATQDLIRNVESGGAGLAKMGIHIEATGNRSKDLALVVQALSAKFGGAAAADAASLSGQLKSASDAFEDIQKSIGGAIAEFVQSTGVVQRLTEAMRALNDELFTSTATKQAESPEYIAQQVKYWEDITAGHIKGYKDFENRVEFTFEEAQQKLAEWQAKLNPQNFNAAFDTKLSPVTGQTAFGARNAKPIASGDDFDAFTPSPRVDAMAEESARILEEEKKLNAQSLELQRLDQAESLKLYMEGVKAEEEAMRDSHREELRLVREQQNALEAEAKKWEDAGQAIGGAFVNALTDQLAKLAQGEEFDVAIFVGEILAAAVAIAGTVIGTAFGQPALGASLGNLAAMGVRAGAGAISNARKPPTMHSGGMVEAEGLPRYHSGAFIREDERMAVLQTGERVQSRAEVAASGGRYGDGMGRPSISVSIMAIDSKSAAESFESDLGMGLKRALRTGRGDVPRLLGVTPR